MTINGNKVGFLYSIGADCDIDDELKKVGVSDFLSFMERIGTAQAYAKIGAILNKWYCRKNGGDPISEADILMLPAGQLTTLQNDVSKAMAEGQKTEIESKPVKSKNAKSAAKSN